MINRVPSHCASRPRTVRSDGRRRPRGDARGPLRTANAVPPTPSAPLPMRALPATRALPPERVRVSGALRASTATTHASVPTQSSKCSSRSRSSARARARVLLYHGPFLIPAVAVDATSARLLDGVEAGLRRRRGVVPVAACARPGGRVSSLAWRETRTISPRRDHEDAARRRAAASNS